MNIIDRPSPNFWQGHSQPVSKVIIHWMVSNLAAADGHIRNPASEVSAHYGIEDNTVYRWVREENTAWHARQANPFSIGIEHSAQPGRPASEATYQTSAALIADICRRHRLNPDTAIEPHSKYVATQCPGTMDLNRLKSMVKSTLGGEMPVPDADNYYWRYGQKLSGQVRGRHLSRDEFRKHLVGKSDLRVVEILSDDPEADRTQHAQNVGQLALKDNWQGQIGTLQAQLGKNTALITDIQKRLADADALGKTKDSEIEKLKAANDKLVAEKSDDTILLDETGSWLTKLLNRLFKRS